MIGKFVFFKFAAFMDAKHIIGKYDQGIKGPLLICFGGIHGNEPAGVDALKVILHLLNIEPITNPGFQFTGRIVGILGNVKAFAKKQRYILKDLNRHWTKENVERVKRTDISDLDPEDQEMKEILEVVEKEIEFYKPENTYILDLHTTTAHGGIFTIATDDPESVRIGMESHAPVIKGLIDGISGTIMHYFTSENFNTRIVAVTFESGQHEDPLSMNRAIASLTNCMRSIDCVRAEDVENRHDSLLIEYSRELPNVAELIMCHRIQPGDGFKMKPNYKNFQQVKKGEVLATDKTGEIKAVADGCILMPHYQKQGEDGFFLVRTVEGY